MASPVACPACRSPALAPGPGGVVCGACGAVYPLEDGFPVLLGPGDARFADETDCCTLENEEETNRYTTAHYYLPLIARTFAGRKDLALLSAGCGIGADVDAFRAAGIDAYGVDCGARCSQWGRRVHRAALQIGSVLNLPYGDASFDVIVTGCLFPHIGVEGDSTVVTADHRQKRARVADELMRVLRPGGLIVTGNPNRRCPVDLFHKGQMQGGLMRWHAPDEPFLLSLADYRAFFAGAARVETLPPARYWGFHSKRRDPKMWVLVGALRAWFAVLSLPGLGGLRASGLNPWLMVGVRKA
ncbi:MAG: methyltransferase domain-containing protein [Gemmobacter sp.]